MDKQWYLMHKLMHIHNRKLHGKKSMLRFFFFSKDKLTLIRLKNGKPLTPDLGFESQFDVKTGQITLKHKGSNS